MTPSTYQQAIFNAFVSKADNLIIEAVAGSGKTTTIVELLKLIPKGRTALFVAFNKSIAEELSHRVPDGVLCSTLHSVAYKVMSSSLGKLYTTTWKTSNILKDIVLNMEHDEDKEIFYDLGRNLTRFISILKGNPNTLTRNEIEALAESFDEELPSMDIVYLTYSWSIKYDKSLRDHPCSTIDFDDMLRLALPCQMWPTYDYVFVDEAQDLNEVQRLIVQKLIGANGRLIAVGDSHQAIYAFRGADSDSMRLMRERFNCLALPLSVSYRCSKAVVQDAQRFTQIEAAESAESGRVVEVSEEFLSNTVGRGDMVVCRCNWPLAELARSLIQRNVPVCILGSDVVSGLIKLAKLVEKKFGIINPVTLLKYAQSSGLTGPKQDTLEDKLRTIEGFCGGMAITIKGLETLIKALYKDVPDSSCVLLCSIHKAKGLEAERVFITRMDLLPHPKATNLEQERNLEYVAITRAKRELYKGVAD